MDQNSDEFLPSISRIKNRKGRISKKTLPPPPSVFSEEQERMNVEEAVFEDENEVEIIEKKPEKSLISIEKFDSLVNEYGDDVEVLNELHNKLVFHLNKNRIRNLTIFCNILEIENVIENKKLKLRKILSKDLREKGIFFNEIVLFEEKDEIKQKQPNEYDILLYFFVDITRSVNLVHNIVERGYDFGFKRENVIVIQFAEANYLKSSDYDIHLVFEEGEFFKIELFLEKLHKKIVQIIQPFL